jgi:prepilin-type N-terminal cleavage/methylation domain-containing protein
MKKVQYKKAFTLVELLIAMAISAIILTAVATAINGSYINYQQNQDIYNSINGARTALHRMTTELRTASAVGTGSATNICSLITSSGDDISYSYDSDDNTLYLVTNDDLTDADYILCENVTAMNFSKQTFTEDSVTYVRSVLISMTVTNGDIAQQASSAVVIRRNLR